jgi:cell division inhibitor SepF
MVSSRRAVAPHLVPVDDGERWYGDGEETAGIGQRIATVRPRSFTDAKVIGEYFRAGVPVIMNLADLEESDAKRIVDFASGLIFSLRGGIERVAARVFLLTPAGLEIVDGAETPSQDPGFFNQG